MTQQETALFEALNAKKLSPGEIAASFVIPAQYDQLVGPDHSFLVGPRGSGKTTLLRMLQGEALMSWSHRRAQEYRRRIRYSSVFLPADRLWASQMQTLPTELSGEQLGTAAFCSQLLYALVETMLYRLGEYQQGQGVLHPAELEHRAEVDLVWECSQAWRLKVRTPSLLALQGALDLRLGELANLLEGSEYESTIDIADLRTWLPLSPLEAFRFGLRAFNRHTKQPHHRWALLLDEMELAPESVHRSLTGALRGSEKNLVLKLSFSPFDRYAAAQSGPGLASPDHDFRPIYLWYGTRVGGRRFTGGLWRRMMEDGAGRYRPAIAVLGASEIDVSGRTWNSQAYAPGSRRYRLISKMAASDPSFRSYLVRHDIDPDRIEDVDSRQRSSTLRKAYPLLVFRDAVLEFRKGQATRRARKKTTECFTGSDAVFAALEGNPRWIKAVFSQLLSTYIPDERIERGLQYDTLREAADRFESLLRVLPPDNDGGPGVPVLPLLDDIARYFSEKSFGAFTADPPSVFRVDKKVPRAVVGALKTALSAGAVVHLRGKESPPVLPDLYGERFRLAYLLTIRDGFEVPFRIGKTTNLSSILAWSRQHRAEGVGSDTIMAQSFDFDRRD